VAAVLLGTQVVLGGLTVLQLLATWSVTLHLVFGNLFLLSLLAVRARVLDLRTPRVAVHRGPALALVAAVAIQVVLGGLTSSSYAGLACTEWPSCLGGAWFPAWDGNVGLQLAHRWWAFVVLAAAGTCVVSLRGDTHARRPVVVVALLAAQIGLGVANVLLALPVELAVLHSATADAIIVATAITAHGVLTREAA
jgi:cytochrome c oxidase assembly protein subunit 15